MASPICRSLCRTTRCRLYSTQTVRKMDSSSSAKSEPAKVTKVGGLTVASVENFSPLSRVMVAVKAGSKNEDATNLGITHCIRHAAELSNDSKTSFKLIKDLQSLAGGFSASTTRDYAFYTVECLRDNIPVAVENLAPMITRTLFRPANWLEYKGMRPQIEMDLALLNEQPNVKVMELLHAAAFKDTLGNSLYSPTSFVGTHSADQVLNFMKAHYTADRVALVGCGVDHESLVTLANNFKFNATAKTANDKKPAYHGGEIREDRPDLGMTYVAVATEGPSLSSKDLLAGAVLQQIMGTGPHIKWSPNIAGSKLGQAVAKATNAPFMINGLNVNYTDSGLFGFVAAAPPQEMDKVIKAAFAEMAATTKASLTDADVARGKNQLMASLMMSAECGDNLITNMAGQALTSGSVQSASDTAAMVNALTTADIANVAKKLVNSKPSMSAVGNLSNTPYLHQLI